MRSEQFSRSNKTPTPTLYCFLASALGTRTWPARLPRKRHNIRAPSINFVPNCISYVYNNEQSLPVPLCDAMTFTCTGHDCYPCVFHICPGGFVVVRVACVCVRVCVCVCVCVCAHWPIIESVPRSTSLAGLIKGIYSYDGSVPHRASCNTQHSLFAELLLLS
jgi:hypothetical protein